MSAPRDNCFGRNSSEPRYPPNTVFPRDWNFDSQLKRMKADFAKVVGPMDLTGKFQAGPRKSCKHSVRMTGSFSRTKNWKCLFLLWEELSFKNWYIKCIFIGPILVKRKSVANRDYCYNMRSCGSTLIYLLQIITKADLHWKFWTKSRNDVE